MITTLPSAIDSSAPATEHARKITKAAREFEAVLLNTLLGPLEKTFSSLPGKETDAVSEDYQSVGMQALASSLAAKRWSGNRGDDRQESIAVGQRCRHS